MLLPMLPQLTRQIISYGFPITVFLAMEFLEVLVDLLLAQEFVLVDLLLEFVLLEVEVVEFVLVEGGEVVGSIHLNIKVLYKGE